MKDLIKKELVLIEENADLLRNNYDPVIFEFNGYEKEYFVVIEFNPFSIHVEKRDNAGLCFSYDEDSNKYYVSSKKSKLSREMDKDEEKIFKSFIDKIYERSEKSYASWW